MAISHTKKVSTSGIVSIVFPDKSTDRARHVVSRSSRRPTGKIPSWKMGRMIHWESPIERNAVKLLDADPAVIQFCEQPCEITYLLDGGKHSFFPDLLVCYRESKEFWEVVKSAEAISSENANRIELFRATLPKFGYGYRLVVAEEIESGHRLANSEVLLRYGRKPVPLIERERIRRIILRAGGISWQSVLDGHVGPSGREYICRLLLEGVLHIEISRPLTGHTVISLSSTDTSD